MPVFAVLFEDDPVLAGTVRRQHMPDHLAFLRRNAATIASAGPLRDAATGEAAGGLWVVTCEDREAAETLVREDPFWPTGLRRSVRILAWQQVFSDGRCL